MPKTICPNCGAPLSGETCEYCGAVHKTRKQTKTLDDVLAEMDDLMDEYIDDEDEDDDELIITVNGLPIADELCDETIAKRSKIGSWIVVIFTFIFTLVVLGVLAYFVGNCLS